MKLRSSIFNASYTIQRIVNNKVSATKKEIVINIPYLNKKYSRIDLEAILVNKLILEINRNKVEVDPKHRIEKYIFGRMRSWYIPNTHLIKDIECVIRPKNKTIYLVVTIDDGEESFMLFLEGLNSDDKLEAGKQITAWLSIIEEELKNVHAANN